MRSLDTLTACTGTWQGFNRLQDPESGKALESTSLATVTSMIGGKFVRWDYTWAYRGDAQEGSFLIGCAEKPLAVMLYWIDSWHNSEKLMTCLGEVETDGSLNVLGSYAAPPGPDWGWRTVIRADEGRFLRFVMYNIWPDGKEELAVEAEFQCK